MTRTIVFALIGLLGAGCGSLTQCEDCTSGPPTPTIGLSDDGTTLSITGCELVGFVGCTGSTETITANVDGQAFVVPAVDDQTVQYDHRIDVASPASPQIEIVDNSLSTGMISELAAFSVRGPIDVSRTVTRPITLDYDVISNASVRGTAMTTCDGGATILTTEIALVDSGHFELDLDAVSGDCTTTVAITQTVTTMVDPIAISIARVERYGFRTTP